MEFRLLPWITVIAVAWCGNASPTPDQYTRGLDWLSRYGYLPPPDPRSNRLQTMDGIKKAVRDMQRFGGIRETGEIDDDTIKLMSAPRCSLPDIIGNEDMRRRRRRRYALAGVQWDKKDLTWSVHKYPSPSLSPSLTPSRVDDILRRAFEAWSDAAPLRFAQQPQSDRAGSVPGGDIRVSFIRSLHDDGYPFDGRGGTLAHAFFPGRDEVAGDTHFDDDEIWSREGENSAGSTDLFTVAVHEFGHALGLSHSSTDPSIMRPYYQGPVRSRNYRLPLDDVLAIQQLYGVKYGRPTYPTATVDPNPAPPPFDPSLPDRCEGGFDAVANVRGEVFFFRGVYFWRRVQDGSLVSDNPALIKNFWMGLPPDTNKIDAVYERKSDSCIIFFIGSQYWVFKDTKAMEGYPRPLSDWGMKTKGGKPVDRVDAAFIWAHNGHTYLFSGGEYWRFDESRGSQSLAKQPESGYPRDVSRWRGVPSDPDDIISWGTGETQVFKDNYYLVLKGGEMGEDDVTRKSTAVDWLKCKAPPPTKAPQRPKSEDCSCGITGSSSSVHSGWLLLLLALWALHEFTGE